MIRIIQGILKELDGPAALIHLDSAGADGQGITYQVLLQAYAAARLSGQGAQGGRIGHPITLHTLHYLESQGQGAVFIPRLAGFLTPHDRAFFELFTTVKGIGYRKALRAMTIDTSRIAAAIADRDLAVLQSLPEVGRRTADTIVATLRGKVDAFVSASAYSPTGTSDTADAGIDSPSTPLAREAMEILLQLGENRIQVIQWIDRAMMADDPPKDTQQLLEQVYLIKSGA
jgi:Holliday junction DNA helicase RuvA